MFGTRAALMTGADALTGEVIVEMDDAVTTPAVVPLLPSSPYRVNKVTARKSVQVHFADGVEFLRLRAMEGPVNVTVLSTGPSPAPITDLVSPEQFFFTKQATVSAISGGKPLIDTTDAGPAMTMEILFANNSNFGQSGGFAVMNLGVGGHLCQISCTGLAGLRKNSWASVPGALTFYIADSGAVLGEQTLALGGITEFVDFQGPARAVSPKRPLRAAIAPQNADSWNFQIARSDGSGCPLAHGIAARPYVNKLC